MSSKTEWRRLPLLESASSIALAGGSGRVSRRAASVIAVACLSALGAGSAAAFHPIPDNPRAVGEIGPLIPFHKDAIHAVVVWTGVNRDKPKVCFWMRPAEYRGTDLVDPLGLSPDLGDTGGFIACLPSPRPRRVGIQRPAGPERAVAHQGRHPAG